MPESFLHGVEVVEITNGARSIQTVRSSIIGLVGTAPNAEAAVSASAEFGSGTSKLTFTAAAGYSGLLGNDVTVRIVNPGTASAALAVTVSGKNITISLATDVSKVPTSTAATVKTAYDAVPAAVALAACTSGGAGVVSTAPTTYLTGGKDVAFPLDTPVLITPGDGMFSRLGEAGSLYRAIDNIWKQAGVPVVVVRVTQTTSDSNAATVTAVAGSVAAKTGAGALIGAESLTGFCPRVLIAPGFTHDKAVADNLVAVAQRLRAVVIADGPNTTDAAAIAYAGQFGSDRIMVIDPKVLVSRAEGNVQESASSFVAGIIGKVDNELGFWWSPSNKEVNGVVSLARAIDFQLGDQNAAANLLNEKTVCTIVRAQGYRIWGNLSCSADPKFQFLCVRRTADIIQDSILRAHLWAVDRGITKTYLSDVSESVNAYLASLIAQGALVGDQSVQGKINACWPDPDLNTPANIAKGNVFFNVAFTPPYPAQHITFRSELNNNGLTSLIS